MIDWVLAAVAFQVLEVLLEVYLYYRQSRHIKKTMSPPDIFKDVKPEEFQASKDYSYTRACFSMFSVIYGAIPSIIFTFTLRKFWNWSGIFQHEILHTASFDILTSLISEILSIPVSYYAKFVIDEKFGFNKSTIKLWVTDMIKGFLVNAVMSFLMYGGLILIWKLIGKYFITVALAFLFVLTIVIQTIYPIWIMPLFTKLTPLEDNDVRKSVMKLADECNFNMSEVYSTDDSKRSTKQNAMMFGLFKHRVAIADTALSTATSDEVVAIIAHEIGHSKHHHIWQMMILQQILFGGMIVAIDRVMKSDALFAAFGFTDEKPLIIGIMIVSYLAMPISKILQLPMNIWQRRMEFQADAFAAKKNLKLEAALVKLHGENKSMIDPEPLYHTFNSSHPTLFQRVQAIRAIQTKLE